MAMFSDRVSFLRNMHPTALGDMSRSFGGPMRKPGSEGMPAPYMPGVFDPPRQGNLEMGVHGGWASMPSRPMFDRPGGQGFDPGGPVQQTFQAPGMTQFPTMGEGSQTGGKN